MRSGITSFELIHVDYHYDDICDIAEEDFHAFEVESSFEVIQQAVSDGSVIRWDSFIAPSVIRRTVSSLHFLCYQDSDAPGLPSKLIERFKCAQAFYENPRSLSSANITGPYIFDLCLDVFNYEGDGCNARLWPDDLIAAFIDDLNVLILGATGITISASFQSFLDDNLVRHIAAIVLPKIKTIRGNLPT